MNLAEEAEGLTAYMIKTRPLASQTRHCFPERPPCKHRPVRKRALLWASFLPIILLSGLLINWVTLIPVAFALSSTTGDPSGHLTYQEFLRLSQLQGTPSVQRPSQDSSLLSPAQPSQTAQALPSVEPAKMLDQTYVLDNSFVLNRPRTASLPAQGVTNAVDGLNIPVGTTPFVATGSDGRLEVRVPRGSFNLAKAQLASGVIPVGEFFLSLHQISGHTIG
ncbi:MAG TPA: hypothetical protein VFN35_26200, partial [Ktedonobacteraceae bacterium]|nr:hypothetical protein [Ktedonobacteraceae bacterium]